MSLELDRDLSGAGRHLLRRVVNWNQVACVRYMQESVLHLQGEVLFEVVDDHLRNVHVERPRIRLRVAVLNRVHDLHL